MIRLLILPLVLALAVPALAEDKKEKADKATALPVGFQKLTYDKAIAKAKNDKKVVMVDFYTDWCGYCKKLDAETFTDKKVEQFLKDKTIAIKVNAEQDKKLATKYKVTGYPCLVFVNGEGKEVGRIPGYMPANSFLTAAGKIVK